MSITDLERRAHFPAKTLEAAESGPGRPTLPVVEAYVRACGDEPDEWEDRWRVLPEYFKIAHLGRDGSRRPVGTLVLVAGMVLAAGGGALLALRALSHQAAPVAPGHTAAATAPPARAAAMPPASQRVTPSAQPRPTSSAPSVGQVTTSPATTTPVNTVPVVTGFGCPQGAGNGVTVDNAATGPGWKAAGAGWTGNGCDGGSVWTVSPNGNQPASSTLTWFFAPVPAASSCTVAVFVPARNALGVADYAVSTGAASSATVTVDQASAAGRWVTLGSYRVNGSPLDVQVSPGAATLTGPGKGRGRNAAIAASAARATCA